MAIDYALGWSVETTWPRIKRLGELLRVRLVELGFVTVHDLGAERCGIVTFSVDGADSTEIQRRLAERNINVTVSLEEYSRTDLGERGIPHMVRASVHYYNTEEEIGQFCNALVEISNAARAA